MAKKNKDPKDICAILLDRFQPEQPLQSRKNISTSEKGCCYKAIVDPERATVIFTVDNCIIKDKNKCDRLVLSKHPISASDWIGHFIELKGCDIHHAIDQLEQSLQHQIFSHGTLSKKYTRIVGRSFPSNAGNLELESAKNRFRSKYKCELKSLKSNQPDRI